MKSLIFIQLFFFLVFGIKAQSKDFQLPKNTSQVILVITKNWGNSKGQLYFLEKYHHSQNWEKTLDFEVSIGRNGLAWGVGLFPKTFQENAKKEGDGKSPAGFFDLDYVFGYEYPDFFLNMPFIKMDSNWICVDDTDSDFYNRVFNQNTKKKDWKSFEEMRRKDKQYLWGITVKHNQNAELSAGSCIFLHIWKSENYPTSGCTAMSQENLLQMIQKLDENSHPILIQLPQEIYKKEFAFLNFFKTFEQRDHFNQSL